MPQLSEKQLYSLQKADQRQNIWCGSVRSGKTFSSILKFLALCKELPPGDAAIIGVSRETIQRNILELLCDLTGIPIPTSKSPLMHVLGRRVHLIGAPDESAVRRIKGSTLVLAYIDELTDVPESFYKMVLSRLSLDNAKLLATTNPEGPNHWLKRNVLDNEDINLKTFYFGLDDNPTLSESYKNELKKEYTGVWYDRYILGKWTRAEGLVFDGFDPALNVDDVLKRPIGTKIVGIDYGTTNPTSCHLIDIKPNSWPQIYVEKEYYWDPKVEGYTKTDGELADDIHEFLQPNLVETVYVDPSAASLKNELSRKGLPVADANNDVLGRVKVGNKFLKQLNIMINSGCKNLINQLQSQVWDQKMSDKGEDVPLKRDDHANDSCFYAIFSRFPNGELEEFYTADKLEELYHEAIKEMHG